MLFLISNHKESYCLIYFNIMCIFLQLFFVAFYITFLLQILFLFSYTILELLFHFYVILGSYFCTYTCRSPQNCTKKAQVSLYLQIYLCLFVIYDFFTCKIATNTTCVIASRITVFGLFSFIFYHPFCYFF